MSAYIEVQAQRDVMVQEWRVSPAFPELEAEWEHAACCAEAHRLDESQQAAPLPFDPDEWWPESCVA